MSALDFGHFPQSPNSTAYSGCSRGAVRGGVWGYDEVRVMVTLAPRLLQRWSYSTCHSSISRHTFASWRSIHNGRQLWTTALTRTQTFPQK